MLFLLFGGLKISVQPGKAQTGDLVRTGKHSPRPLIRFARADHVGWHNPRIMQIGRTRSHPPDA